MEVLPDSCLRKEKGVSKRKSDRENGRLEYRIGSAGPTPVIVRLFTVSVALHPNEELVNLLIAPEPVALVIN